MSKAVNSKWKKTFPDTIGNQKRPATGVDDTQEFETGAFPQYMANDPVRYDLQNAAMSQLMSNDARLKEMVDARGKELDDHKVDPGAHKTGIAGNAATATKVVTTAATGASANIAEASMAGDDSARIRVSGAYNAGELALETADDGNEAIVARQYTGTYTTPVRTAKILDESGNTSFPGTVVAPKFTGTLNGNAATASKLASPRTLSLTGKAAGSTSFDGSANVTINVTSVNADTASKATQDGAGNVITNTYLKKAGDTATGDLTAPNFVGHLKGNADTATHANDIADATMNMTVSTKENAQTTAAAGVINQLESLTGSTDLKSMSKLRSFVGSVFGPDWYNVISIRHRNGAGDGQNHGLLMYSRFENTDSIKYKKQGVNGWTEERTLLDSSNYNSYAPTKTGSGASGTWGINITGNAASATTAGNVSGKIYYSTDSPSVATDKLFTVKQAHAGDDNVPNNGLVIQTGPASASWNGKLYITDNGTDGVWVGGVSEGKEVGWTRLVENKGTWGINISGNAASATNADKVDGYHASDLLGKIYPVGSIYMSMSATNPHDLFGVGTWKRISQGRMLLGADDSTYKAGATGGEATHTLTAAEMPAHSHGISTSGDHSHYFYGSNNNNGPLTEGDGLDTEGNSHFTRNVRFTTSSAGAHTHTISNSGGGAAHNNMSPYLVCYIWQRTA